MEKVNFYYIKRSENLFPNNTFKGGYFERKGTATIPLQPI